MNNCASSTKGYRIIQKAFCIRLGLEKRMQFTSLSNNQVSRRRCSFYHTQPRVYLTLIILIVKFTDSLHTYCYQWTVGNLQELEPRQNM